MLAIVVPLIRFIYYVSVSTLVLYTAGQLYLLYTYMRNYRPRSNGGKPEGLPEVSEAKLPKVTVQLPLFNERYVARRIIDAVAALDYPRDRLHIQVLDDSTDDTADLVQARVTQLAAEGLNIEVRHRIDRKGYKAGALAEALPYTDSEFIAIFDADFIPAPDFLRMTVPYFFTGEKIGVVQTRWGHLNLEDNILTKSQGLAIDSHFAVEQQARSRGNLIFSFNGTGGLWRRTCIEDAGGWQADTLTEDFDLSYRAQIKGWKFVFVRDVVVPGELPPQMYAYRQQQARWAKGSTQVLLKMTIPLLMSKLSPRIKFMGMLQLFQYTVQPVIMLSLLLTPYMIATHALQNVSVSPAILLALAGPLLCFLGQEAIYPDWPHRLARFPLLLVFSTGMVVNNSRAAIAALLGKAGDFKRTPKYNLQGKGSHWQRSQYAGLKGLDYLWDIAFTGYALFGVWVAYTHRMPSFIPYFLMYAIGFTTIALYDLYDKRAMEAEQQKPNLRSSGVTSSDAEPLRQIGR